MVVFVTGGSGFVGRNLIRACIARGDRVLALARSPQARQQVEQLGAQAVAADLDSVTAAQLAGVQCVIHAAAKVSEWGARDEFRSVNVDGTRHLLEVARTAGVSSFVLIGTEAAYADGNPIIDVDETRPLPAHPLPRYPATKSEADRMVRAANAPGFRTVVVRPRLIWGRDDTSVLPQLIEAVKKGQFAWVNGGRYLTSTCHVANVCEGALLAAEHGRGGEAYFLTDGAPVEFRDFMTRLFATRGMGAPDRTIPFGVAKLFAATCEKLWEWLPLPGHPPLTRMAINLGAQQVTVRDAKARRELGYRGQVSIEQGLAELASNRFGI
ncbi:MAG TPA: NAD-dependent epimerase/dehydratase family protein [Nevskiaceae bacterium]|nr:NAD-dependent epimerase/dehydratase family protein [Nevskiaceae bacterium]